MKEKVARQSQAMKEKLKILPFEKPTKYETLKPRGVYKSVPRSVTRLLSTSNSKRKVRKEPP